MKHSIFTKFLAFLLSACSLMAAIAGTVGIVAMENAGLYVNGLSELQAQEYDSIAFDIAHRYASRYAADSLSNLPYMLKEALYADPYDRADADYWCVKLSLDGEVLVEPGDVEDYSLVTEFTVAPHYPIVADTSQHDEADTAPTTAVTTPSARSSAAREDASESVPEGWLYEDRYYLWSDVSFYHLYYYQGPEYTVTVYMQPEVLESSDLHILTGIYPYRYWAIAVLAVGLMLFAVGIVFLCWSAGKAKDGTIRPGGLNRIPLDLYALGICTGIFLLLALFIALCEWVENEGGHPGNLSLLALNLLVIILLGLAFLFAFCAQIKVKGGYWWHHSVIGWCLGKLFKGIRFLCRGIGRVFGMLPVIWQWLLTAVLMLLGVVFTFILYLASIDSRLEPIFLLLFLASFPTCVGIVLYGGYCFGTLLKGARSMAQGNLEQKIPTKYLIGSFRDFAQQLNALSETAMLEAQNRLKSERMKTELITNVSHDIKTPLTSIINFVDLLQKPHTEAEGAQYLDVLSRQSARMKKLIEDLMDLSKASTGNIPVSFIRMDAAEAVQQALGEFADKLDRAGLTPVFRRPQEPVWILADGRLVWRVLSNLLSNAVKYAMPGTRLYIDLSQQNGTARLALKNISREALQVSAEELMERFVQGDASRNSEGSGLGLNIAQSLMEVQRGRMAVALDGDLFKVTLSFQVPR